MQKNKYRMILLSIMALLMGSLITITLLTKQKGYENLLLVSPKFNKDSSVDIDKLDRINEDNFLLTYEVIEEKQIQVLASRYSVILKGTNYTYPFVMRYTFVNGSFFTRSAQEQKLKSVVLNEAAAFKIFGSFHIIGKKILLEDVPYTITGIIRDGDEENNNIYLPAAHMNKQPDAFMAGMEPERGITQEYIKNTFKQADITEVDYDFINLDEMGRKMEKETGIALFSVLAVIFLLRLRAGIFKFAVISRNIKELLKQYYFKELIHVKSGMLCCIGFTGLCIVLYVTALLIILKNVAELCLYMNFFYDILKDFGKGGFFTKVQLIQHNFIYSAAFFSGYIVLFLIYAVLIWEKQNKSDGSLIEKAVEK